ncbi:hypothetical protein INS49_011970 [Diaporthe citri]|uniref:uncharacterized protein n=1 Tax=Diaporthe citri TaxID=83186 RepID=UPI001C8104B9|nr:uncharacterized protein INS49_011970 [Diaporthe citri]KAG6360902.1 hypothetical protein INS49_011970 [Diaporthe citri]
MATDLDRLAKQNLDLLESGNFADVEIICQGRTWKVHKVILQSRCRWFEKAFENNWQEAQTGRIYLQDEQPEQVNELLKFIYIGRYIPAAEPRKGCISIAVLAKTVSLWRPADFFLLPDLKEAIQEYLISRLAAVLWFFHNFRFYLVTREALHNKSVDQKDALANFYVDFSQAVAEIYKSYGARQIHKLFAAFACGLREHMSEHVIWDLMKRVPEFQKDVSNALVTLHFPKAGDELLSGGLKNLCLSEAWKADSVWSTGDGSGFRCSKCGEQSPEMGKATSSRGEVRDMTLDPFPLGTRKWCNDCAFSSIKSLLEAMINR